MLYRFFLVIFIFPIFAYAGDSTTVDWGKWEIQFYSDLKTTQGKHTEAELQQALGYMLLDKDQWQRAAIHYKKAVRLDPTLFNSWYNLGLIYIDKEAGDEYFRRAIKANPNYPPPLYWLGYNCCKAGKYKEAIPLFKKYIKIATKINNPEDFDVINSTIGLLNELYSGKEGKMLKVIRQ